MKDLNMSILILILIAAMTAQSPGSEKTESWFEVFFNGQKVGFEHHCIEKSTYRGIPCYKTRDISEGRVIVEGRNSVITSDSTSYFGLDMTPFYSVEKTTEKNQVTVNEIIISGREILFRKKLGKSETAKKIPFRKGYTFGVSTPMLRHRGLKPGNHYVLSSIYGDRGTIEKETVTILKRETITPGTRPIACTPVRIEHSALPGVPMMVWLDDRGETVQTSSLSLKTTRCDEKTARTYGSISSFSNFIPVHTLVPKTEDISEMTLRITLDSSRTDHLLADCPYQSVAVHDRGLDVTLHSVAGSESTGNSLREREPFLSPSILINSRDPGIMKMSRTISSTGKSDGDRIRLLCSWIYRNLKKEKSEVSLQSASETLKKRSGDCTEHAVLFCAMARSLGIPARQSCGLIYTGSSFGYHAWAEAYCGRWIPVDATADRTGVPAIYIEFGNDSEGLPSEQTNLKVIKMLGSSAIEILSLTMSGERHVMGEPDSYVIHSENRCINKLWGLEMEKPSPWRWKSGNAELMALEGPGGSRLWIAPVLLMSNDDLKALTGRIPALLGIDSDALSLSPPEGRSIGVHSIAETPLSAVIDSRACRGSMVLIASGTRMYFALFMSPAECHEKNYEDFERMLNSLTF